MEKPNFEIEVQDEYDFTRNQKRNKLLCDIMNILMTHRFMDDDSIYGENSIVGLLTSDSVSNNWPQMTSCAMSNKSIQLQTVNHYTNLFKSQMNKYVTYAISIGDMLPFDFISKHENVIDISKEYKDSETNSKNTDAYIWFYEDEVDTVRSYGYKMVLPFLDEMVIRHNRNRYMYVKTIKNDEKDKTVILELSDYIGDKYEWICTGKTLIKLTLKDETENGLPCEWNIINSISYEELLAKNIPEMNWSKEQINFWCDVMGIGSIESQVLIRIDKYDGHEFSDRFILKHESDIQRLKKLTNGEIQISILAKGQDVIQYQSQKISERLFIMYIKAITAINLAIMTTKDTINKSDADESHDKNTTAFISTKDDSTIITLRKIKMQLKTNLIEKVKEAIIC